MRANKCIRMQICKVLSWLNLLISYETLPQFAGINNSQPRFHVRRPVGRLKPIMVAIMGWISHGSRAIS